MASVNGSLVGKGVKDSEFSVLSLLKSLDKLQKVQAIIRKLRDDTKNGKLTNDRE
jgi:hypothetical protein